MTTTPEANKTETGVTGHTPDNPKQEGPCTSSPLVQTPKLVLRHNTRPLRDRRPPKILGERFFTSAVTTETQEIIVVTAKDTSDEDLIVLPQAESSTSGVKTVSRPRRRAQVEERVPPKKCPSARKKSQPK